MGELGRWPSHVGTTEGVIRHPVLRILFPVTQKGEFDEEGLLFPRNMQ